MIWRRGPHCLLLLLSLALAARLPTAALIPSPGYMDAAYYAAGAVRLAQGGGFSEPFIWNYLSHPTGTLHPGYLYWMPLPSLVAAPLSAISRGSFFAIQLPFAILAALIPLVAYSLAWQATGHRLLAWAAGLMSIFSGFLFPYWTLPETFAPVTSEDLEALDNLRTDHLSLVRDFDSAYELSSLEEGSLELVLG